MEALKEEERERWGLGQMALSSPCLVSPDFARGSAEGLPNKSSDLSQSWPGQEENQEIATLQYGGLGFFFYIFLCILCTSNF